MTLREAGVPRGARPPAAASPDRPLPVHLKDDQTWPVEATEPRAARWARVGIVIQLVVLAVVLIWVVAGRPGLESAVHLVERHLGLAGGDVFAPAAAPRQPVTSHQPRAVNEGRGALQTRLEFPLPEAPAAGAADPTPDQRPRHPVGTVRVGSPCEDT